MKYIFIPIIAFFSIHTQAQETVKWHTDMMQAVDLSIKEKKPLKITEGLTHDLRNPPPGCAFQFRCPHVKNLCRAEKPKLKEYAPDQFAACHMYEANWATAN